MATSPSTPHSLLGLALLPGGSGSTSGSSSSSALRTRVTVGSASGSSHATGVLGGSSNVATSSTSLMSGVASTSSLGGLFSSANTGSTTPTSSTPANAASVPAGSSMNPPSALLAAHRGIPLAPSLTTAQGAHAHTRPSASTSASAFGSVGSRSSARQQQQQHGAGAGPSIRHTNAYLDRGNGKVEVLPCFREDAENRGNVLVIVSGVEFWVHKDILFFASPFFRALLEGDWKESHPSLHSRSDSSHSSSSSSSQVEEEEDDTADYITPISDAARERDTPPTTLAQLRVSDEPDVIAPAPEEAGGVAPSSDESLDLAAKRLSETTSPRASFHSALHTLDTAPSSPMFASDQTSTAHLRRRSASEGAGGRPLLAALTLQTPSANQAASSSAASAVSAPVRPGSTPLVPLASRLRNLATPPGSPRHSTADPAFDTAPSSRTYEPMRSASAPKLFSSKQQQQRAFPAVESEASAPRETSAERRKRRVDRRKARDSAVAVVRLPEEDAGTFQDVLCHVYPHLELCVTWYNIAGLMRFTDKYAVPFLRRSCTSWLRVALAGRPIEAMALGEQHGLEDVYKDASRSVLDNMTSWEPEELAVLSGETLLKLERKRTWFLERLLKLGLANPARDYECCAACPDPGFCARSLQERWQAAYAASFRFGPPQPSVIWRHLRELEGGGAGQPLAACHKTSQAWVQSLFDRMFTTALSTPPKFLSIKLNDPPRPPFGRTQ